MSQSTTFPPPGPTALTQTLPSYPYFQYRDDDDIAAFFAAYNEIAQGYFDWDTAINLPIYTGSMIAGPLLDWVATGLYGIPRPALAYGSVQGLGAVNTFYVNQIAVNAFTVSGVINTFVATDDIYKRVITWDFYKGDGQVFSIEWLKKRVMRFLLGIAGTAPNIDNTYPVSVAFSGSNTVTITITLTSSAGITLSIAQVFQAAVASGVVALPFQFSFVVDIVNDLSATDLTNSSGALHVTVGAGWPTSATGLAAGSVWNNSHAVEVVAGITPNPYAAPVFFGLVTSAQLLVLGGGNLPTSNPGAGTQQLWNSSGAVLIA